MGAAANRTHPRAAAVAVAGGDGGTVRADGPDAASWYRKLRDRAVDLRIEVATHLGGTVCILAIWGISRWKLTAHRPLWLVFGLFATVAVSAWVADAVHRARPNRLTTQVRIAAPAIGVTAIIYVIGWGPALAIGYVFPLLSITFGGVTRRTVDLAFWPVAGLVGGQLLNSTGVVSLLLDHRDAVALTVGDGAGVVLFCLVISQVAIVKEDAERGLAYAASHDLLTGLMNRSAFTEALPRLMAANRRGERPVALFFCDLLGFKAVNDRFGHIAGDGVLVEIANRIASCTRAEDMVGRFGGDEFVLAIAAPASTDTTLALAERLLHTIERPVALDDVEVVVGCSIGVAYAAASLAEIDVLFRQADAAMYEAKVRGTSTCILREVSSSPAALRR